MKKHLALLLAVIMLITLCACGDTGDTDTTVSTQSTEGLTTTVKPGTVPEKPVPESYADIDFALGSVTDIKGKIALEIKTNGIAAPAVVEEVTASFGNAAKVLPALRIKNVGTWVKGVFSDFADGAEMNAFVEGSGGFSIEVFYLDNSTTGANRGIVCSTESISGDGKRSGWGIAENADGAPYFITGHVAENVYSSVYGTKASETELVHVVAVYNAKTMRNSIYMNGVLVSSNNSAGKFTSANKTEAYEGFDMGNVFYIGADPSSSPNKKEKCDFPSNDLTVLDVKFYACALTGEEVDTVFNIARETIG